jgi:protocatechuate 3,4-dioxygenase beta subunit
MNDKQFKNENRRQFIKSAALFAAALPLLNFTNDSCEAQTKERSSKDIVGGGCDGCESIYEGMPAQISWQTNIAPDSEPGERIKISGVIYKRDGKTPAPDVILYVYHTDAKGYYSPRRI